MKIILIVVGILGLIFLNKKSKSEELSIALSPLFIVGDKIKRKVAYSGDLYNWLEIREVNPDSGVNQYIARILDGDMAGFDIVFDISATDNNYYKI
jgi:hypothetical protein